MRDSQANAFTDGTLLMSSGVWFSGIRLHSPQIIPGNATPAPSAHTKIGKSRTGLGLQHSPTPHHMERLAFYTLYRVLDLLHAICVARLCRFLQFVHVDAHTCIEAIKYTCLHAMLKRKEYFAAYLKITSSLNKNCSRETRYCTILNSSLLHRVELYQNT